MAFLLSLQANIEKTTKIVYNVIQYSYKRKEFIMRLITRSDFDGLACGALLKEAGIIDSWKFAHPKDLQDGLVEVT